MKTYVYLKDDEVNSEYIYGSIQRNYPDAIVYRSILRNQKIDALIQKLVHNDVLLVYSLNALGPSIYNILKRIREIANKNAILKVVGGEQVINFTNINLIEMLYKIEEDRIAKKAIKRNKTLKENSTNVGRKKGHKVKSIFDEDKKTILKLHKNGVSYKKIIDKIGVGTPQGLGKYIKQIEELQQMKSSQKNTKNKTYFDNKPTIYDIPKI